MSNKDKPRSVFIPNNYKAGLSFFGFKINLRYAIEGGILATFPLIIGFIVVPKLLGISLVDTFTVTFFFALLFGAVGIYGIDGSPISVYIKDIINAKNNKRESYYNPRVKNEINSIFINKSEGEQMLPREKILEIINNYQKQIDEKTQKEMENSLEAMKNNNAFFEDDIGIIEKPTEYMSDKELKLIEKQKRKEQANERKKEKAKGRKKAK